MLAGTVIAAIVTYGLMLIAIYGHRRRGFHAAVMGSVILFDLLMPVYLVLTRDWGRRLIEEGDILSFGVWTHFGLLVALYVLYGVQVQSALVLRHGGHAGEETEEISEARKAHRAQAKGILLVRALVIFTGALLAE